MEKKYNKIINKRCFIKKENKVYCSKCGKVQLQDTYNYKKHMEECDFQKYDMEDVYEENKDFTYAFFVKNNKLYFNIYTIKLTLRPGFKDKYIGGNWEKIFEAIFIEKNQIEEKGLYNVDFWMKRMIDEKNICSLNPDSIRLIKSFFPIITHIYNFGMFLDLYRATGYKYNKIISDKRASDLLQEDLLNLKESNNCYSLKLIKEKDVFFLKIELIFKCKKYKILVSNNYIYTNKIFPIDCFYSNQLLQMNDSYNLLMPIYLIDEIEEFDEKYPGFMIKKYIENNGTNFFIPLFSKYFNKCLELSYKANLIHFAEYFKKVIEENKINIYGNNLKEIYGLSLNVLKKIDNVDNDFPFYCYKNLLLKMKEIIQEEPKYLNLKKYNSGFYKFIYDKELNPLNKIKNKEIFKIAQYIIEKDIHHYQYTYYIDYLSICLRMDNFVDGLFPKDIVISHDLANNIYSINSNKFITNKFMEQVNNINYKELCNDYKDNSKLENEEYVIISPKTPLDLANESASLHHCVKTYVEKVANGYTYIYFLRKKSEINKPLATIEVLPDKTLIQLKAYCNTKASIDAQNFIKKWALEKNIKISSYDLN